MDVRSHIRRARLQAYAHAPLRKPLLVAVGNCQVAGVAALLRRSPSFQDRYTVAVLPGVHEIRPLDVPLLHRLVARASVVLNQRVRDDYRGLAVGSGRLRGLMPTSATYLLMSTVYYRGLHPATVYVHEPSGPAIQAPRTAEYHDLRVIAAAAAARDEPAAPEHVRVTPLAPGHVDRIRQDSTEELARRDAGVDVPSHDLLLHEDAPTVWTPNHPTNQVLAGLAKRIQEALGSVPDAGAPEEELLGSIRIPTETSSVASTDRVWHTPGGPLPQDDLFRLHLDFYRRRPEVLARALDEHSAALSELGLRP